jgi:uncharacterized protein (TIGR03437 family)
MRVGLILVLVLCLSGPAAAEDSVFVDGAFNGRWGASFPPFIPEIIGPINFQQIEEADGLAGMERLRPGSAAAMCPAASEKREFYGGDYDYQRRGEFFGCTNGETLVGVYLDFDQTDRGSIRINQTFPDDSPPHWAGTFTNIDNDTGDMRGLYQGEGIATPLARVGDEPPELVSLSGASYSSEFGFATESFVTAFGQNLASGTFVDSSLPTALGGVMVRITDTMGQEHDARLYVVSPTQINYLIPEGVASGMATVEVIRDGEVIATETILISMVSPALFSADATGAGAAAAVYLRVDPDGTRTDGLIFDGSLMPVPLDFGPEGAELYVFLFGTGMRNFSGEVTVTIDGMPVPFAGPVAQGEFEGLDQINLGPLPRSLAGRGVVEIVITVDGKQANVVTVAL